MKTRNGTIFHKIMNHKVFKGKLKRHFCLQIFEIEAEKKKRKIIVIHCTGKFMIRKEKAKQKEKSFFELASCKN